MGADDVTRQMAKRQAGKVQGTDADLRRMTTAQAKERLRCACHAGPALPGALQARWASSLVTAGLRLERPLYAG